MTISIPTKLKKPKRWCINSSLLEQYNTVCISNGTYSFNVFSFSGTRGQPTRITKQEIILLRKILRIDPWFFDNYSDIAKKYTCVEINFKKYQKYFDKIKKT